MSSPPGFSLVTEPWIQCELADGGTGMFGIRDIFDGRNPIRSVRGDSPAQDYAVLRVLLSVFWRAHQPETAVRAGETFDFDDWFDDALDGTRDADDLVLDYLDAWRDRFDLLHPTHPFMQVADLHTKKGSHSEIQRIIPEAEDEYFTMRAGEGRRDISLAEAARWVIYTQAYDYSGIKSGAEGDPRVKGGRGYPIGTGWTGRTGGTVVVGDDLRSTLLLNTTMEALTDPDDRPAWERTPDTAAERHLPPPDGAGEKAGPQGPNDLATWQARRIRLHVDGDRVDGVLVSNGDRIPDAGANVLDDPMTPYRYSRNKSKKGRVVHYALPFDPNRTMWRSLEPLISLERDPGFDGKNVAPKRPGNLSQLADLSREIDVPPILDVHMVSVSYGPQDSSVSTTVEGRIDLPVALLARDAGEVRATVIATAAATRDAAVALGQFGGHLLEAAGGEYEFQPDPTDGILAELEPKFAHWLGHLDVADAERQARSWQLEVRRDVLEKAAELLRGAGPKALAGREIGGDADGSGTRILSAGSAYRMLQNRLKKILHLIDDPTRDKEKNR